MKIYVSRKTLSDDYFEVGYIEYLDGEKVNEGTEDFSGARYNKISRFEVWVWDGVTRNKGGKRQFERIASFRSTGKAAEIKAAYIKECKEKGENIPAEISVRKI